MIYIQKHNELPNLPHHFDCACALYGALDVGIEPTDICFIDYYDLDKLNKNVFKLNLFVGSVEFMRKVYQLQGITEEPKIDIYDYRDYKEMNLGDAIDIAKKTPIFVKPTTIKLFTGLVLDNYSITCLKDIPRDTEVLVYDVLDIQSEYRCYVHNNKVVGIKDYSGNNIKYPYNSEWLLINVANNKDFPIAYTMDIAVLGDGSHTIIEYNDFWAIGNYGLENDRYYRMLKERYFEIVRKNNK